MKIGVPLRRVLGQTGLNKRAEHCGLRTEWWEGLRAMEMRQLLPCLPCKGHLTHGHLEQHHPKCVDVGAHLHTRGIIKKFRRHVCGWHCSRVSRRWCEQRQAKVGDLRHSVTGHETVLGCDTTVY